MTTVLIELRDTVTHEHESVWVVEFKRVQP